MAVEIFKTNITDAVLAGELLRELDCLIPQSRINFDLEDCDKILRVEAESIPCQTIIDLMNKNGYQAEVLI